MQKTTKTFLFLGTLFLCFPLSALAAELRVLQPFGTVHVGDTFIVEVSVSADGTPVNAVEGSLAVSPNLEIKEIRLARSVIPLWVEEPTISGNTISFAGVIPGGFEGVLGNLWQGFRAGTLFRIVLTAREVGASSISPEENTAVYLNDGEGSKGILNAFRTTFVVLPQGEVTKEILPDRNDVVPPETFTPLISEGDAFGFTGRALVFSTQDKQTGIAYYEVAVHTFLRSEDDLSWERALSPYQLSESTRTKFVYVRAVDVAGNTRVAVVEPELTSFLKQVPPYVLGGLLLALLIVFAWFFHRSRAR